MSKKKDHRQLEIGNEVNRKILGEYMGIRGIEHLSNDVFRCDPDESAGLAEKFADFESPPATPIDGEMSEDGYWVFKQDPNHEDGGYWAELPVAHREEDNIRQPSGEKADGS